MTRLLVFGVAVLAASASFARPSTLGMSCQQAQNLVARSGAIVLSTGGQTYDRFVANPGYCLFGEYVYNGYAPTKDSQQCPLGYVCKPNPPLFDDEGDFGRNRFFFGR